jgi:hypothetical protein
MEAEYGVGELPVLDPEAEDLRVIRRAREPLQT